LYLFNKNTANNQIILANTQDGQCDSVDGTSRVVQLNIDRKYAEDGGLVALKNLEYRMSGL
jgi:hypothetical protein